MSSSIFEAVLNYLVIFDHSYLGAIYKADGKLWDLKEFTTGTSQMSISGVLFSGIVQFLLESSNLFVGTGLASVWLPDDLNKANGLGFLFFRHVNFHFQ